MKPNLRLVPVAPAGAKPLLRWAGGKSWFVREFGDDLFALVIKQGGRYIEPFLGGGSMALYLGLKEMLLGDSEDELVITYQTIRDEPTQLATLLSLLEEHHGSSKETYYQVRQTKALSRVEIAARLIYLNRLCFNGIYRKNAKGEFNVPYGGKEKTMPTLEQILEVSRALSHSEIFSGDFERLVREAREGDVLYVDPPYHGTFGDYTALGFSDADHERLAAALFEARKRGAVFLLHNSDTEFVRSLYDWANVIEIDERRNVNSKGDGREAVGCVVVTEGI